MKIKYTKKEQKENRKKFIKALRSGNYKQGKGQLKSKRGKYCVLGVLCKIAGLKFSKDNRCEGHLWIAPKEARDFVGLEDPYGTFTDLITGRQNSLANLNDWKGFNFQQLADLIEYHSSDMFI